MSSSPSSSHVKDDSAIDNIVLENENQHRHSSRDANKNKIFASLICLTKSRSSANKDTLSATTTLTNNSAAKEKHRKQKDASRKERKATQTLAIVLGKFVQSICNSVLPTFIYFGKNAVFVVIKGLNSATKSTCTMCTAYQYENL